MNRWALRNFKKACEIRGYYCELTLALNLRFRLVVERAQAAAARDSERVVVGITSSSRTRATDVSRMLFS